MFAKWIRVTLGAAALVASGLTVAAENPTTLAGGTIVSAEQAKALIDKGAPVFDLRTANEYAEGHIKGAKLIAYKEKSAKEAAFDASKDDFDLSKLPADKNATIVLYCNGLDCWKSYKGSVVAIKAGYKKIHWMRGGFPEWKGKGYPVE
jgi:rhodanese-related sulfurtransferase